MGITTGVKRRVWRGILATAAAMASLGVSVAPAMAAQPLATNTTGLTVAVASDNAGVLVPGQDLTVSVTITNSGNSMYLAGSANLWLASAPLTSRSAYAGWLSPSDDSGQPAGSTVLGTASTGAIPPATTTTVQITVPAASVPFSAQPGQETYGIGSTLSIGANTQATGRSSVVWNPADTGTRTNVAVAYPITSPPGSNGVISSADLATYTAPNGVLSRQLDGILGHASVAIGIDPMIIASIRALGSAAPPSATEWLIRLAQAPNDIFPLGYGDADPTGQIQAGLPAPLAPVSLSYALNPANFQTPAPAVGEPSPTETPPVTVSTPTPTPPPTGPALPTMEELLSWKYTLGGIAWPGDNTVRTADLATLASAGLTTTILAGTNTNSSSLEATPNALLTFNGGKGLVADAGISTAIRAAATAGSDAAWRGAMAQVNAQLELIGHEKASSPRTILVTFDRGWPSSGTQLARTLDSLAASPWATTTTLPAALSTTPATGVDIKDSPESTQRIRSISSLVGVEGSVDSFASVLDDPSTMTGQARTQLLTLLAVSWQNPRNDWPTAVAASLKASSDILNAVKIIQTENVNLVSAQGSIPFTISNSLKGEAVTVVVRAAPSNGRIEIDSATTKKVQANSRATVLIPVKAKLGNGQVTLTLQLVSQSGVAIGGPTSVPVDVHADWEGIGALIIGILLVLLFGFGIVRNILRRRREAREEDAEDAAARADAPAVAPGDTTAPGPVPGRAGTPGEPRG
ncbi:MAG: hypothetical protein QOF36_1759 [Microbacteriaceae bacterium]|nr:hypothetical protein [Microbacteriaceae bacterium]